MLAERWTKWTKEAEILVEEKAVTLGEALSNVTEEEVEMWEMWGKAMEGNLSRTLQVEVGLVCLRRIQLTVAAKPVCSGRLELEGHSGREGEGERWNSRRENEAP